MHRFLFRPLGLIIKSSSLLGQCDSQSNAHPSNVCSCRHSCALRQSQQSCNKVWYPPSTITNMFGRLRVLSAACWMRPANWVAVEYLSGSEIAADGSAIGCFLYRPGEYEALQTGLLLMIFTEVRVLRMAQQLAASCTGLESMSGMVRQIGSSMQRMAQQASRRRMAATWKWQPPDGLTR